MPSDQGGRLEPSAINLAEARRAFRAAGIGPVPVKIEPLTGGFSSVVQLVTLADGTVFVLRMFRTNGQARKEEALVSMVAGHVPVAKVVFGDAGYMFGRRFAILENIEGLHLDHVLSEMGAEAATQAGTSVGSVLASIGRFHFDGSGFLEASLRPSGSPTADADGILSYVRERLFSPIGLEALGEEVRRKYWTILQRDIGLVEGVGPEVSLVHCDFNGKNILMKSTDEGWVVAAVIDWEFAFSGSPLWDIANMLRFSDEYHSEFVSAFVSSFQANGGVLPANWGKMGRVMDSVNVAEFIARGPTGPFYNRARALVMGAVERGEV